LTKAVETCFPQATTLLCCRHLEENVRRQLLDSRRSSRSAAGYCQACLWYCETCRRVFPDNSWHSRTLFSTTEIRTAQLL